MLCLLALLLTLAYYGFLFRWEATRNKALKPQAQNEKQERSEEVTIDNEEEELPLIAPSKSASLFQFYEKDSGKQHRLSTSNEEKNIASEALEEQFELLGSVLLERQKIIKEQNAEDKKPSSVHRIKI